MRRNRAGVLSSALVAGPRSPGPRFAPGRSIEMSTIEIRRKHHYTASQARRHAERLAADLDREFGLEYAWRQDVLEFRRDGIDGELRLGDREIELRARLGFLLGLMRPKIESSIHAHLDELFGGADEPAPAARKRRRAPAGRKST
jgi:putative polyhydroxyalkanoate system protein